MPCCWRTLSYACDWGRVGVGWVSGWGFGCKLLNARILSRAGPDLSRELERGTHLEQPEEGDLIRRAALGDGDFLGVVQDILHDLRIKGLTGEGCQLECLAIGLESNLARELW